MRRLLPTLVLAALLAWLGLSFFSPTPATPTGATTPAAATESTFAPPRAPALPGERLTIGYGDPGTPPIDDLRMLHHVLGGYFSVIKDLTRHPIGGNADLTACLLGENVSRQRFLGDDHPAVRNGLLVDRWQTPLFVHPEAARELTLRSAGPDRTMFTADDLVVLPDGGIGN